MRISTAQIFSTGTSSILNNQSSLFKVQNQLSTGRRVLTPADDPVASAQVLTTTQARNVNAQYMDNQENASSQLGLLDGSLDGLTQLIHEVRERAVQLGDAALTDRDRGYIAAEFRARFEDLVGIANTQNANGQYLFSGFQGATKPFAVNPPATPPYTAVTPAVSYYGDQGERLLQVEASRQMSISASGLEVFMNVRHGNGEFSVSTPVVAPLNAGTAIADQGAVIDINKWTASPVQPQDFQIQFRVDSTVNPPVTYYNLIDTASSVSMFSGGAPSAGPPYVGDWKVFTPGQSVPFSGLDPAFGTDLGVAVQINGEPADGDRFDVKSSLNQSVFDTFQNLIELAATPVTTGASGNTEFMNDLGAQLSALDRSLDNLLKTRASVGSRLSELASLTATGGDLDLQHSARISNLQDLDYASAITTLSRRQMQLEAAQASFVRVSGLSLFSVMS